MRKRFIEELNILNNELIVMGSMCEEAIKTNIEQIKNRKYDGELYDKVSRLEYDTDRKEKDMESLCIKLIYSEQPVAKDLRFISAVLKMVSDLERIGDQALDISDLLKEMHDISMINETDIMKMFELVSDMVKESVESFVKRDEKLAKKVMKMDDQADEIFLKIKNQVIMMIEKDDDSKEAVDILMMAKYLERIGDHSTNIAEWVVYTING